MNTTVPTPPPAVGSVHASSLVVSIEAKYAEHIRQVTVEFTSYDHVRISSVHLDVATAAQLADQLTAAVDAADGHWTPKQDDVLGQFDRNRASK